MSESRSILVTIKFSFEGPVSHEELQEAIGRALNTRQFRLVGRYTILDCNDEIMVEVPKKPAEAAVRTMEAAAMPAAPTEPVGPAAPILQISPKR
jgi:hypothetical protein